MSKSAADIPDNLCKWRFRPRLAEAQLSAPQWKPLDAAKREHYAMQIRTLLHAVRSKASDAQLAQLWRDSHESQWREDMRKGAFEYFVAEFDLDNDGKTEQVLMEDRVDCSEKWPSPPSPQLYVIDPATERLDRRYGVWDANVLNPFFHRGRTLLAYLEYLPVDPQVVDGRRVYRDADGREHWFAADDVPVGTVRIAAPVKPGLNNPFLYGKAICSFNLHLR